MEKNLLCRKGIPLLKRFIEKREMVKIGVKRHAKQVTRETGFKGRLKRTKDRMEVIIQTERVYMQKTSA